MVIAIMQRGIALLFLCSVIFYAKIQMKKVITILVIAIAVFTAVYFFYFRNKKESFSWRTTSVVKGDVTVTVTATGSINALTTVQVGTQVSGTISKLVADFNSVVKEGQVIAMLDTTFLAASREEAAANVEKLFAQLDLTKRDLDRSKKLFDEKVIPQAEFDLAMTNYESASSSLRSAKALLNRAKINLQYATIKAPISGTVISRNVDVGQTVISSFNSPTLFTIANDLKKMQVQANIDEADIGEIKVGQFVSFSVDAFPNDIFSGSVKQIRLQPTVLQNVVNYIVIVDVDNSGLKLMPGLTANINVKIVEHKDVLKVQMNALHFSPPAEYFTAENGLPDSIKEKWNGFVKENNEKGNTNMRDTIANGYVWIKKDKTIFPVQVLVGISDGTFVEISGKIKQGDEIVLGQNHEAESKSATTTQNPFMPKFPTGRRGR